MKTKTLYNEYMKEEEFERLMAQEDLIMEVTESFCEILNVKGMKRSSLAKTMGKTKGYISQILNGGRNITLRSLSDIAFSLGYYVSIRFSEKAAQKTQNMISLNWKLSTKKKLPKEKIHVADDYLYSDRKFSRLGS